MTIAPRFWEHTPLEQMSKEEWESLCDGCAKCCLQKLEDEDTGDVYYTDIACRYLKADDCGCKIYLQRNTKVPNCLWLKPEHLPEFNWLPQSCSYRLIYEGKPLPPWHHLISGTRKTVHKSFNSIKHFYVCESRVPESKWEDHIIAKAT